MGSSKAHLAELRANLMDLRIRRDSRENYLDNLEVSRVQEDSLEEVRQEIRELDGMIRALQAEIDGMELGPAQLALFNRRKSMSKKNPLRIRSHYSGSKHDDYYDINYRETGIDSLPSHSQLKRATKRIGGALRKENEMKRAAIDFKYEGPKKSKSKKDQAYDVYWKRGSEKWTGRAQMPLKAKAKTNPDITEMKQEAAARIRARLAKARRNPVPRRVKIK